MKCKSHETLEAQETSLKAHLGGPERLGMKSTGC